VPQVEVTFDIDANGIVNVSAKDLGTGREQHITITSSTNLSKDDISKAVQEAEQYAAEDQKRKEEADTRNQADQIVYQSEKALADAGDKIDAADKKTIEDELAKVRTALAGTDVEAIKAASEELQKAFFAVSEKLYAQTGGDGDTGAGTPGGGDAAGGEYYDADYEVVDDDGGN
jgi:molecular chaperone DnaK